MYCGNKFIKECHIIYWSFYCYGTEESFCDNNVASFTKSDNITFNP